MTEPTPAIRPDATKTGAAIDMDEFRAAMREADLEDIIDDLIEAFVQDAPGRFAAIEAAVVSGDTESVRLTAHAYKSSAATMYAHQLTGLLRLLEQAGAAGDAERTVTLLPQVGAAHEATMRQLTVDAA
jgi:HPt (histidine-containing phosphotransfer) domain-containing protein